MSRAQENKKEFLYEKFHSPENSSDEEMSDEVLEDVKIEWDEFMEAWETNITRRLQDYLYKLQDDGILFDPRDAMETEQYYMILQAMKEAIFIVHK